jgi:hypothetical protein
VFKHIIASNNLKPFRIRIVYANAGVGINNQGTTTLMKGDEADDNKTDQAKDEATALEVEGEVKMERENKIFLNKSYISKDRMFAVVV